MEVLEADDSKFSLCKCCLQDGSFRSLWDEYLDENGLLRNYGEMLNECFSLRWQKPDNFHLEQICDDCSKRAADAFSFRQLVLLSQEQLNSHTEQTTKNECASLLDPESGIITVIVKEEVFDSEALGEYEEVEYLEMEDDKDLKVQDAAVELGAEGTGDQNDDPDYKPKLEKKIESQLSPKNKRGQRTGQRTYKNYSNEDLKQSVEAAKSGALTVAEASAFYNVPRKTIAARLRSDKRGVPIATKASRDEGLIREIKTLLTYTNMTPYKTRTAHYHCAYCSTDGPQFEDPDELRTHTRTEHAGERTKAVEIFMRPSWLNEILKVDIENLYCTVCCSLLVSWNDMFKHLKEKHNLDFDEGYTRVVPYILKNELRCALCKENLPNYHHLDAHMNAHYNNYMCSECGDTFVAASRLKKHLKIHETGRYICDECGKVFSLDKYRQKHVDLVHKQAQKIQCLYCPEKFTATYPRHLHVLEKHSEKVRPITCELCGKSFQWKPYYFAHVRRKHQNERNYKCKFCSCKFFMKSEVKRHEDAHIRKNQHLAAQRTCKYACRVCNKPYSTKNCLITHYNTHPDIVEKYDDLNALAEMSAVEGLNVKLS